MQMVGNNLIYSLILRPGWSAYSVKSIFGFFKVAVFCFHFSFFGQMYSTLSFRFYNSYFISYFVGIR
uniref:Uncharacterized protein n=1 Tax=Arundo donax TaxID=35708 RepID=A0A0A9FY81_ARUDO